jgi:hypothetical protein
MIGVSVVLAIALMVGAFTAIFALLDPFVGDFVQDGAGNDPAPTRSVAQFAATTPPESGAPASTAPTATIPPTEVPATTAATPPPADAFEADYRVSSTSRINFRGGPGVRFEVVTTVAPGTDVQYLNESQVTQNPGADLLAANGQWLKFRLQDGDEGWIRDVDVTQLSP